MPTSTQEIFKKVFILAFLAIGGLMVASGFGVAIGFEINLIVYLLIMLLIIFIGFNVAFHIGVQKLQKEDWIIVILLIGSITALFYFKIIPTPSSMIGTMTQVASIVGG